VDSPKQWATLGERYWEQMFLIGDTDNHDCIAEQFWAERNGLA
jgi:hypothetical protein